MSLEEIEIEKKKKMIIEHIINSRKINANKIINKYKYHKYSYENILNFKKNLIIQNIINFRINNINFLLKNIRAFLIRKKVHDYLSYVKTCYIIESNFDSNSEAYLKVYSGKKPILFQFDYDYFLNKYVIYIPRKNITKNEYKANFIKNNEIILDMNYLTTEENGIYVNVINFDIIKREENKKAEKTRTLVRNLVRYLNRKGLSVVPKKILNEFKSEQEDEGDELVFHSDEENDKESTNDDSKKNLKHKKVQFGILDRRSSHHISTVSAFKNKYYNSQLFQTNPKLHTIKKPKSILKLDLVKEENLENRIRKRRNTMKTICKKVSFA
jgi:hypothetical protein